MSKIEKIGGNPTGYSEAELLEIDAGDSYHSPPEINTFTQDQIDGTDPDWTYVKTASNTATLLASKALNITVENVLDYNNVSNPGNQNLAWAKSGRYASGIFANSDAAKLNYIFIRDDSNNTIIFLRTYTGDVLQVNDGAYHDILTIADNTYYYFHFDNNVAANEVEVEIYNLATGEKLYTGLWTPINNVAIEELKVLDYDLQNGYHLYYSSFYVGDDKAKSWMNLAPGMVETPSLKVGAHYLEKIIPVGEANALYMACPPRGYGANSSDAKAVFRTKWSHCAIATATTGNTRYTLDIPLPRRRGNLDLHISGFRWEIYAASSTAKCITIRLSELVGATAGTKKSYATDIDSSGTHTEDWSGGVQNCGGLKPVFLVLDISQTVAYAFQFGLFEVEYWYE